MPSDPVKISIPTVANHVLNWELIAEADSYRVQIIDDEQTANDIELSGTALDLTDLDLPIGKYQIKVQAIQEGNPLSQFSEPIDYMSYGQISHLSPIKSEGALGAFEDLISQEAYLGYGFNVLDQNEFSSKTVKISNPIFDQSEILKQRLLRVNENRSNVNEFSANSVDELIQSWNASTGVDVSYLLGSTNIKAKYSGGNKEAKELFFSGIDVYNQTCYLVLQSDLNTLKEKLSESFRKDLYNPNVSPATLFDRYGTHYLVSCSLGGRITSHYSMASETRENFHDIEAKISVSVRYFVGQTDVDVVGGYHKLAKEKNVNISNSLSVIGGGNFGMLSDSDLRDSYKDWEKSLNTNPALMGLKDANSLVPIWDLIDEGFEQGGIRKAQLQEYFDRDGIDKYNELISYYGIREVEKLKDITDIKINGVLSGNGVFDGASGSTVIMTSRYEPEDVICYSPSITLDQSSLEKGYAKVEDGGKIHISSVVPSHAVILVTVSAGSISKTIKIRVIKSFTVSFEAYPSNEILPLFDIPDGAIIQKPADPKLTHFSFVGWYRDKNRTISFDFGEPITGDTVLYAKFIPTVYRVTLELNGGIGDSRIYTDILQDLKLIPPIAPIKTGYDFVGWYADSEFFHKFDFEKEYYTEELKLFAKWKVQKFTVSYYIEEWSNVPYYTQIHEYNQVINISLAPTKNGYDFAGWYYDRSYQNICWSFDTVSKDVSLFAKWSQGLKSVVFITGLADPSKIEQKRTYGDFLDAPIITRTGYTLEGWYKDENFEKKWNFATDSIEENKTILYAKWQPNRYSIYFQANGGLGEMKEIEAIYDQPLTLPSNQFAQNNAKFKCWNTRIDGSGKNYYNGEIVYNLSDNDDTFVFLYAQWLYESFFVIFHSNDGTNAQYSQEIRLDMLNKLKQNVFSNEGCNFVGWATEPDGQVVFKDGAPILFETAPLTLYARWDTVVRFLNIDGETIDEITVMVGKSIKLPKKVTNGYSGVWVSESGLPYAFETNVTIKESEIFSLRLTPEKYTVSLLDLGEIEVTYGQNLPVCKPPAKENFAFCGYYSQTSGKGKQYFDHFMNSVSTYDLTESSIFYPYYIPFATTIVFHERADDMVITDKTLIWDNYRDLELNVAMLKRIGYTKLDFTLSIDISEKNDGWQLVYAEFTNSQYKDISLKDKNQQASSGANRIAPIVIEHGAGKKLSQWKTYVLIMGSKCIDFFVQPTKIRLGYWADGYNKDDWVRGITKLTIIAYP